MPFGKIGVLIVAVAVAIGLGGFGAALKSWTSPDPVDAVTLADVDARKDDADDAELVQDDDDDRPVSTEEWQARGRRWLEELRRRFEPIYEQRTGGPRT